MADALDDDFAATSSHSGSQAADSDGEVDGQVRELQDLDEDDGDVYDNDSVGIGEDDERRIAGAKKGVGEVPAESKKRKRKEKDRARRQKKAQERAQAAGVGSSIADSPADLQLDFLQAKQRLAFPKLTQMELDERGLEESMLKELGTKTDRNVDTLAAVIAQALPKLKAALLGPSTSTSLQPGSPFVIVVTGNAMRAADLARGLRPLLPVPEPDSTQPPATKRPRKDASAVRAVTKEESRPAERVLRVAKLFARHQKLKEQADQLSFQLVPFALGTPQRISALIDQGALKLSQLQLLVVDTTWKDAKDRTIFDGPETREATFRLLASKAVSEALKKDSAAQLALF